MSEQDEIVRLGRALADAQARIAQLEAQVQRVHTSNVRLGLLLAKTILAEITTPTQAMTLYGPHAIASYHLSTEHKCGDEIGPDGSPLQCRDVVQYHNGPPEVCPWCGAGTKDLAETIRRGDHRSLPGRPWGMGKEELN